MSIMCHRIMDKYINNFPLGFYKEFIEEIKHLDIEVITFKDLFQDSDDWDYKSFYPNEFKNWKKKRDKNKRYLLIQHDVDLNPCLTEAVVELELEFGIRSNIFLFSQRWDCDKPNCCLSCQSCLFSRSSKTGICHRVSPKRPAKG